MSNPTDAAFLAVNDLLETCSMTGAQMAERIQRAIDDSTARLEARVDALEKALSRYAQHTRVCERVIFPNGDCTCGLDTAKAALARE